MVIGTTCLAALAAAANVRVTCPLVKLFVLSEAVTPEGKPVIASVTVPNPNESTRRRAIAFPPDMLYDPRSRPREKSVNEGVGAVHAPTGEVDGWDQVEV